MKQQSIGLNLLEPNSDKLFRKLVGIFAFRIGWPLVPPEPVALSSADSDVATIGSQIARFGITPVGHLGGCFVDQVRRIFPLWDARGGAGMPEERALAGSG